METSKKWEQVESEYNQHNDPFSQEVCPNCHEFLDPEDYGYCAYCGHKEEE